MKKGIGYFTAFAAVMLLTSCGSSDYDKGYSAGYADGVSALSESFAEGYAEGLKNTSEAVTVYGDFTATVRQLVPDYEAGGKTSWGAVITLFQGKPMIIRLNEDICSEIQVGETYTFEIDEENVTISSCHLADGNSVSSSVDPDRLYIKSFRTPYEDEYGLVCWRVKYKQASGEEAGSLTADSL